MKSRGWVVLLGLSVFSVALSHSAPALPDAQIAQPARQFSLPFAGEPSVNSWLLGQLYGNTTGAYRRRNTDYRSGQGIHFGMDFSAACGTPVLAIGDGVVSEVDGSHGSAPHNLVIEHAGNLASLYGHLLQRSSLRVGQRVKRGQQIGLSGDSQFTCISAPHLHLEIRDRSHQRFFNPVGFIAADWNTLALLGSFGRGYQRNLNNPRRWQSLEDQPSARRGGALLNNYALPFPVVLNDRALAYPNRIYRNNLSSTTDGENTIGTLFDISQAGCCVAPLWTKDSKRVMFIDKPTAEPAAIYSIDIANPKAVKREISSVVRLSPSEQFAILSGTPTRLEDLTSGERVSIASNAVFFSPSEKQIAWTTSNQSARFDTVQSNVFVADLIRKPRLQLKNTRVVATLYGGGLSGWLNEKELLLSGKRQANTRDRTLMRLELRSKNLKIFSSALNFRGITIAPNGQYVLYYIAFDSKTRNGLYLLNAQTGSTQKLPWFGAYRFRDANRVVFIPMKNDQTHILLEWDIRNAAQRKLVDLQTKVAVDDWQVSPNGSSMVFVSTSNRALQVVHLPE